MRSMVRLSVVAAWLVATTFIGISRSEQSPTHSTDDGLKTIEQLIGEAREGMEFIGNDELIARTQANPRLVLLDVRTKEEYDAGHLKGATWMEPGVAPFRLARTLREPDAEIIVYCLKSNRSALVAKALRRMGYRNVKAHAGLEKWLQAGLPIQNYLGDFKLVKLREINAATDAPDYYMDKQQ